MKLKELCKILYAETDLILINSSENNGVFCDPIYIPEKYEEYFVLSVEARKKDYICIYINKEEPK